ncbi:MAG: RNA polymerase sigma factor [Thermoleophilia bacterium]
MNDDPASCVPRALAGHRDAATALARRAGRVAMPIASIALGGRDAAADVVQDVVVDVLRDLRGLRDPLAFDAWVRRIASRRVVRAARTERLRRSRELPIADDLADGGGESRVLVRMSVADALRRLPARQRVALSLRYAHDLTDAEIADALGCRPGTAASLLSRGREALRADPGLRALVGADTEQEARL